MSYNIGQFRKDMINDSNYITNLSYESITIQTQTESIVSITFTDRALQLTNALEYGNNYFLKVGIIRQETEQKFDVVLKNNTSTSNLSQTISTFTVPALDNTNNNTAIIELVISPNSSYNQIIFQLRRIADDFTITNEQGTIGRIIKISTSDTSIGQMRNILDTIGQSPLTKIGMQGPSGLLFCINGQEIRIGPNGIYEIKNGYKITFIGCAILPNDVNNNYFILDYQYE